MKPPFEVVHGRNQIHVIILLQFSNQVRVSIKVDAHRRSLEFQEGHLLMIFLAGVCKKLRQGKYGSCRIVMKLDETIWNDLNLNSRTSFSQEGEYDTEVKWQLQTWWHEEY